ncbi:MAG: transposase [Pseudomonadota bacterium]
MLKYRNITLKGKAAKRIKGRSSPKEKEQLWGGELWSDGYFVPSAGDRVTSEVMRRYIRYQHQKQLSFDF